MPKKILIAVTNYGTENEIIEYAIKLEQQTAVKDLCLVVIDNKYNEQKHLEDNLKKLDIDCIYFKANQNYGYLNGALYGVDKFVEKFNYVPQWIVVSNVDIEYTNDTFYEEFLTKTYPDDIWCIAPSVQSLNGNYCNPHYKERISLSKINFLIKIFKHPFLIKIYYKLNYLKSSRNQNSIKQKSQYVYSSHGCFFILRNDFYKALNGEKYGVVLYSEESFIAEFIIENNKKSFYDSSIEIKHMENLVTGNLNYKDRGNYVSSSLEYIKKRFYKKHD